MGQEKNTLGKVETMARDLAAFAVDRTDLKELMETVPEDNALDMTALEYELQLLKILSVGWAVSFFMQASDANKGPLTMNFWEHIREISGNVSTLAQASTGNTIDYFEILKERLDTYLTAMQENPDKSKNPAEIVGPVFASACRSENNPAAILTGTKMFTLTLGAVKDYLNVSGMGDIRLS